jgi:hypothetical protein
MEEKTFGQQFVDARSKLSESFDVRDINQAFREDFFRKLDKAFTIGGAQFIDSFFISVLLKEEQVFDGMPHFYFIPRQTAPYPNPNTLLFFYDHKRDKLDLWWMLPREETCQELMRDLRAHDPSNTEMYKAYLNAKAYFEGSLDKRVKAYEDGITKSNLRPGFNPHDYDDGNLVIQA